jgi:cytochrome c oxidase subunit 2
MARSRALQAVVLVALIAGGVALAQVPSGAAPAADVARGELVFALCSQCHGPAGQGNTLIQAPSIAGLDAWYVEEQLHKFQGGLRGRHPDDYSGMRMRPMALTIQTEGDIPAVAAYVASLKPVRPEATLQGGDAARGAQFYAVCSACHGPDGGGLEALKAPPINHAHDWYLLEQLKKFRAGIRGANPQDASGILMRPMAMTLPDDQALLDVVAHIGTLRPATKTQ